VENVSIAAQASVVNRILTDDECTEFADILVKTNKPEYNVLKLVEELAELQEKVIKYHTKSTERKPSKDDLVEEMGDVTLRIMILGQQLGALNDIDDRIAFKLTKLKGWYDQGKYIGGL